MYAGHRPIDEDRSAGAGVVCLDIQLCLLGHPCAGMPPVPTRHSLFYWRGVACDILVHSRVPVTEAVVPSGARAAALARLGTDSVGVEGYSAQRPVLSSVLTSGAGRADRHPKTAHEVHLEVVIWL